MGKVFKAIILMVAFLIASGPPVKSACCYFSAQGKDVLQPSQKAFINWDPDEQIESFTVQPRFEGNASDFGMVIPTPSRPKLDEMPRDFFKELAVFTILEPMDMEKYKRLQMMPMSKASGAMKDGMRESVRVLEASSALSITRSFRPIAPPTCTRGSRATGTAMGETAQHSTSTSGKVGTLP